MGVQSRVAWVRRGAGARVPEGRDEMTTATKTLKADRALDALAAETVLGWRWFRQQPVREVPTRIIADPATAGIWREMGYQFADGTEAIAKTVHFKVPNFTKSLDVAMLLVAALRATGFFFNLLTVPLDQDYLADFWEGVDHETSFMYYDENPARAATVAAILTAGGNPFVEEEAKS